MSLSNALSYLTVLPIPFKKEVPLSFSVHFFPLVGAGMGSILLLTFLSLKVFIPEYILVLLMVFLLEAMTGGVHLHGLSETADRVLSSSPFSESLQRHRVGVMGITALIFVLWVKVQSLLYIAPHWLHYAIFLTPIIGRSTQALGLIFCKYQMAGDQAQAEFGRARKIRAFLFTMPLLTMVFFFPPETAALLLAQYFLGLTVTYWILNRKNNGLTVQTLSAVAEISETFFLLFCSLLLK